MSIDLLLQLDQTKLKRPEKEVEITRLSKILGEPFIFKLRAITADEWKGIQEMVFNMETQEVDLSEMQIQIVLTGVIDPDLKNSELLIHYNVPTPKELLRKILLPGEIVRAYNAVSELSGYGKKAVEDVKNS